MRNAWIQTEYEHASWWADIDDVVGDPERMMALLEAMIGAGNEHEVAFADADLERDAWLQWERERVIDLEFAGPGKVRAMMAWYDADDRVVEGEVEDVGVLLRGLFPPDADVSMGFMQRGYPPVKSLAGTHRYGGDPPAVLRKSASRETIGFELHSDIWFPFVRGAAHSRWDGKRWFDNRALAERHTPRLNRFLAEFKAAIIDVGGRWLEPEVAKTFVPWVGSHGIRLDGPVPELMPDELLDGEWWR
jgi:hypothetical protein